MAQNQPYKEKSQPVNFTLVDENQAPFACPVENVRLYMYNQSQRRLMRLPIKKLRPGVSVCHWAYVKFFDQAKRVAWSDISTKNRQRMFLIAKDKISNKMFVVISIHNEIPPAALSNTDKAFEQFLYSQQGLLKRFFKSYVSAFSKVLGFAFSAVGVALTSRLINAAIDKMLPPKKSGNISAEHRRSVSIASPVMGKGVGEFPVAESV